MGKRTDLTGILVRVFAVSLMLATVGAFAYATWHAGTLLQQTLDGRQRRETQMHVTHFSLREQMVQSQVNSRVRGWLSIVGKEEISFATERGVLHASLFDPLDARQDAPWALVIHGGLGTDRNQVLDVACELSLSGYHVLTPDLFAHGSSAGTITSLGLAEVQDVYGWVQWIMDRNPRARIVLFGQDEGGVAVLLAASQGLPSQVCAVAADSVYMSIENRMTNLIENHGWMNEKLLKAAYYIEHGMKADEGELTQRLAGCTLPLLLFHGTGDADVPAWHGEDLAASASNASLIFAEGAAHGMARYAEPEKYYDALLSFYQEALSL